MSQTPISSVKRVGSKSDSGGATQPGQLVRDEAGQWDFMGNGGQTATQVTEHILNLEATKYSEDKSGLPSGLSPDVARQVAQALMNEQSPPLSITSPDQPIPNNEHFTANVAQLKAAIAPFLNNPGAMTFLSGSTGTKRFGDIPADGLSLPLNEPT